MYENWICAIFREILIGIYPVMVNKHLLLKHVGINKDGKGSDNDYGL